MTFIKEELLAVSDKIETFFRFCVSIVIRDSDYNHPHRKSKESGAAALPRTKKRFMTNFLSMTNSVFLFNFLFMTKFLISTIVQL